MFDTQANTGESYAFSIQKHTLEDTSSVCKLSDDKNMSSEYDLLGFENLKRPSHNPSVDISTTKINDRLNPQKTVEDTRIEVWIKGPWVEAKPINRTGDSIIPYNRQNTIGQIFTEIQKKSSAVYGTLDLFIQKHEISKQFDVVKQWKDSWNEYGLERPTDLTISHAEHVIATLLDLITSANYRFVTPFISGDGNGNITAIWYVQKRQLHLKIGENDVEYFKVWGTNIDTEMEVDFLEYDQCLTLWEWLINE